MDLSIIIPLYNFEDKVLTLYNKIIDELNSLGCTSFIVTSEQIKSLLNEKDD